MKDYWTRDVAGLFRNGLIPRKMAEADVAPIRPLVTKPVPYHGYFLRAIEANAYETPPVTYAQVTDPAAARGEAPARRWPAAARPGRKAGALAPVRQIAACRGGGGAALVGARGCVVAA